ncbi:MAG: hypothetical protein JSS83_17695 [Cyanobacteria bacterium SZAS LIN-3]|nr:hypothetical protein [Cyanobacteria bacterium SZAS LIN-3]
MIAYPAPATLLNSKSQQVGILSTSDHDKHLFILDAASFKRRPVVVNDNVIDVSWSPDSKLIACRTLWSRISVVNASTGQIVSTPREGGDAVLWAPDKRRFALTQPNGITIWDLQSKSKLLTLSGLKADTKSISWSKDGNYLAASGSNNENDRKARHVKVFSTTTGQETFSATGDTEIGSVGWSKDGAWFAYSDTTVHILNANSMEEVTKLRTAAAGHTVAFAWAPVQDSLAYEGPDGLLHIYDAKNKSERLTIPAEKTGSNSIQWSPDGAYLLLQDRQEQLAICDAKTGKYVGAKVFPEASIARWTPDSKKLVLADFHTESVKLVPLQLQEGQLAFAGGTAGNPWKDQKVLRNIDDCFAELDKFFEPDSLKQFKETPEDKLFLYTGGIGLGMQLRNTWGLWGNNPLVDYFNKLGIEDGHQMSTLIINAYWRHANGRPIEFEKLVEACKKSW